MGYSDFFGYHFIITEKRYHSLVKIAVIFGPDKNPFCKGQKASQTNTLKVYFFYIGVHYF